MSARDEIARALHRADLEPRRFDPHWNVHEWDELTDEAREYWRRLAGALMPIVREAVREGAEGGRNERRPDRPRGYPNAARRIGGRWCRAEGEGGIVSQDQICAHERMLDVHDYCPDCGELRTSWLLEGAKLRARIAELEASNAALRAAAGGA